MSEDYYREFFERADVDGSGCLTEQELIDMLKNNGYKGDDDTIKVSNDRQHCFFLLTL